MIYTTNTSVLCAQARWLRRAVLAAAFACVAVTAAVLLWPHGAVGGLTAALDPGPLPRGAAAVVAAVLALLTSLALWELARMLSRLQHGSLFSPEATRHFRRFALLLLVASALNILLPPALLFALAWSAPASRSIDLEYRGGELLMVLFAAVFFLVARLFDEAARLEEDNRSIV